MPVSLSTPLILLGDPLMGVTGRRGKQSWMVSSPLTPAVTDSWDSSWQVPALSLCSEIPWALADGSNWHAASSCLTMDCRCLASMLPGNCTWLPETHSVVVMFSCSKTQSLPYRVFSMCSDLFQQTPVCDPEARKMNKTQNLPHVNREGKIEKSQ